MRMDVYAHGCIRCSISTRIGIRTELFENDRPMILGWIVTRVVRLRAVLVRVRLGSLHFVANRNCRRECVYKCRNSKNVFHPLPKNVFSMKSEYRSVNRNCCLGIWNLYFVFQFPNRRARCVSWILHGDIWRGTRRFSLLLLLLRLRPNHTWSSLHRVHPLEVSPAPLVVILRTNLSRFTVSTLVCHHRPLRGVKLLRGWRDT